MRGSVRVHVHARTHTHARTRMHARMQVGRHVHARASASNGHAGTRKRASIACRPALLCCKLHVAAEARFWHSCYTVKVLTRVRRTPHWLTSAAVSGAKTRYMPAHHALNFE